LRFQFEPTYFRPIRRYANFTLQVALTWCGSKRLAWSCACQSKSFGQQPTNSTIRIPRKLKKESERRVQDDATRAWNFFPALYYKAYGLPWRLVSDPKQLKTSHIGISFYRTADGDLVHSSSAQMFDERGEGLILRGARALESREDRRPHLLAEGAYKLLSDSLTILRQQHSHFPARVVLHKTSTFDGTAPPPLR
jgi:hypothetical protein